MVSTLEVLFSPMDYRARSKGGFAGSVCVVFDVLRATSVMITGLANGATGFVPVEEIAEAIALRAKYPGALLAGERNGLRITAAQSNGVEFDLGNSPREYSLDRIQGRTIVTTTTNGTRALRSCASAPTVAISSFLNLDATAKWLTHLTPERITLLCAGTAEFAALEDVLCAGALVDALSGMILDDSAVTAQYAYREAQKGLLPVITASRNGSRLQANPELSEDIEFCLRQNVHDFVAVLDSEGIVKRI